MKKQCWTVKNTSWPTKLIKNIISVSVQTDKKRKKKRKKNYFLHALLVVGLKQTPIATNTESYKQEQPFGKLQGKKVAKDQRPQLLHCFHAVSTVFIFLHAQLNETFVEDLGIAWSFHSKNKSEILKYSSTSNMLRKTNVVWHATKYAQRKVLIHNHQMVKKSEIHGSEEYTHIFQIYVLSKHL